MLPYIGSVVIGGEILWQTTNIGNVDNPNEIRISISSSYPRRRPKRRDVQLHFAQVIEDNHLPWIAPMKFSYCIDQDALRENVDIYSDVLWLSGKAIVEPEIEIAEEDLAGHKFYKATLEIILEKSSNADFISKSKEVVFDLLISDSQLNHATKRLFDDGHYSQAVFEAYKLIEEIVREKAGMMETGDIGAKLMRNVLSKGKPKLKINSGITTNDGNEQEGYMEVFAGAMTGIRNPRGHGSIKTDDVQETLELLVLANHLVRKIRAAT